MKGRREPSNIPRACNKEIAERLFVSPHTINTHIQYIYEKLHVHSGIEAVAKAIRERLL